MPRISSPRPLDLTKPFATSSQSYGSQPFDLSSGLVTWYRDIQGDFVPDLSGRGNAARCGGIGSSLRVTGSNDIPEYNLLNYPIRSFDLTDNALAADAQHLRSVGDDGLAVSSEDHTFTDGTQDIPFSVSFWLKHSDQTGTQYLAVKGAVVGTSYEWEIRADSSLRVRLYSGGSSTNYIQALELGATSADWDHFVITYDGSGTSSGINMYKNGVDLSPSRSLVGTYTGMQNSNLGLCVGTAFSNTSYAISDNDFKGKIHSFAIWKNRIISESEAEALYYAYTSGSGGEALGGFISRSPRLHLRELDDLPGAYSTVRRTGDPTRTGTLISNFNDETSIVFSEAGNVVFPAMLPKGSSFMGQAVDIIGQESDISASLPIRSFQQPTHLHYSPTEEIGPFDENRTIPASSFYLTGTDPDVLPGFTSPLRSKIAIQIDITPQSDVKAMRNVDRRTVAEGGSSIGDKTGFLYFNFARKEWEQIGLSDPLDGSSIYYDYAIDNGSISGSFPLQFKLTPGFPGSDLSFRNKNGYSKIGTPISTFGAPSKPIYHATASQCLRMSDYISDPFLLERVHVNFTEVHAQRLQGDSPSLVPEARNGANRDVDNYTFFAYHQRYRGSERDSIQGISGSRRDLIFSGSMTFWNSASFYGSSNEEAILSHSPAFDHNFGLSYITGFQSGQFTGSINMELTPSVAARQRAGISLVPSSTITTLLDQWVGDFWIGGTSFDNFETDAANVFFVGNFSDFFGWSSDPSLEFSPRSNSRALRMLGGEASSPNVVGQTNAAVLSNAEQSAQSPYLLLPSDEIVFGLEAGVSPFRFSNTFSAITGSYLEITTKPCTITLYGSLVKNSVELLPSLNQDLSSNSIHEVIGNEPVLDQFMIEPRSSYYGSYLDEIVTGSMAVLNADGITFTIYDQDNSRRVISRIST